MQLTLPQPLPADHYTATVTVQPLTGGPASWQWGFTSVVPAQPLFLPLIYR